MIENEEKEVVSKDIPLLEVTRENCDSDEELWFSWWLQELKEKEIILDASLNKKSIDLSPKIEHSYNLIKSKTIKRMFQHLFHPHKYTPDFDILFNMQWRDVFYSLLIQGNNIPGHKPVFISCRPDEHASIVEIKPNFDSRGMTRLVTLNLKWVFEKHLLYIQLVKVPDIFEKTFTPQKYIDLMQYQVKSKKGQNKIKWKIKTIDQYVEELSAVRDKLKRANNQQKLFSKDVEIK